MTLPFYIVQRFIFRISDFFKHWYLNSFKAISLSAISSLEKADHIVAFGVSVRHLFSPLFQDRSFVGYGLGFLFRLIRIFFGGLIYFFVISFFVLVYLAWALLPAFLIYKIIF